MMCGVNKAGIRSEIIKGIAKVGEISTRVQESRLKWYGHVLRREEEYVGKKRDGDGGDREEKERKTEAEVVG